MVPPLLCWLTLLLGLMQVFDCLQHRQLNVTVLSDSSVAEYKAADYLHCRSAPFLRSLHSSTFNGQSVCPSLEQPNIFTGLPAAGNHRTCNNFSHKYTKTSVVICALCYFFLVLNHCEVHKISAVVYQCYSDVLGADSVTMETYKPVLTRLGKSIQVSSF